MYDISYPLRVHKSRNRLYLRCIKFTLRSRQDFPVYFEQQITFTHTQMRDKKLINEAFVMVAFLICLVSSVSKQETEEVCCITLGTAIKDGTATIKFHAKTTKNPIQLYFDTIVYNSGSQSFLYCGPRSIQDNLHGTML